jgi:hypothetical protein
MRYLIRFSDQLSKFLMMLAAVWAMGLSMLIVADIVRQQHARAPPSPGVREIVISSIVMIVYLQLGYAIRSHSMLRADTLLYVMPGSCGGSCWPRLRARRRALPDDPAWERSVRPCYAWNTSSSGARARCACRSGRCAS